MHNVLATATDIESPNPCKRVDPDMFFSDSDAILQIAKGLCAECPIRRECLTEALARGERWGVWGGEILENGHVIPRKIGRGRPPVNNRKGLTPNQEKNPGMRGNAAPLAKTIERLKKQGAERARIVHALKAEGRTPTEIRDLTGMNIKTVRGHFKSAPPASVAA
ncbi:WhiB family transcriptional regulator [Actinoplanes sp. CA-054009]